MDPLEFLATEEEPAGRATFSKQAVASADLEDRSDLALERDAPNPYFGSWSFRIGDFTFPESTLSRCLILPNSGYPGPRPAFSISAPWATCNSDSWDWRNC